MTIEEPWKNDASVVPSLGGNTALETCRLRTPWRTPSRQHAASSRARDRRGRLCESLPIERFGLLRQMSGTITIAPAVWDEAVTAGREAGSAKAKVLGATWIKKVGVTDRLTRSTGAGG